MNLIEVIASKKAELTKLENEIKDLEYQLPKANLNNPEMCYIVTLLVKESCDKCQFEEGCVFNGKYDYERFRKLK